MERRWLPYLAAIATVVVWSHAPVLIKYCLRFATPWELLILRHVPAAVAFAAYWAFFRSGRDLRAIIRSDGPKIFLVGLSAVPGYHFALNVGLTKISAGAAALIIGTAPVFTFFMAAALIGERPTALKAAGVGIAFGGLYVCVRYGGGREVEIAYVAAALVTLLSPFLSSIHTSLARPLAQKHGALAVTSLLTIAGTLPLVAFTPASLVAKLPHFTAAFWAANLFLGLVNSGLAYVWWAYALKEIEATRVAVFLYVIPLLGLVWGNIYLDETITAWLILGGTMIVAGVALTNRNEK